jgi:hypothetical protein
LVILNQPHLKDKFEDVLRAGAQENIWTYVRGSKRRMEKIT